MEYYFNKNALQVLQILTQANFESWFVGGCVRDTIFKKNFKDYDIATRAKPDEIVFLFSQANKLDLVGKKYGCIRLHYMGSWYEITTLRKDINQDGRHTSIVYTDNLKEDASRRDFTINALYWNREGLVDFFDGQQDLTNHQVRFIGDSARRVQEDYLRILRFLRFSSIYAEEIDEKGMKACAENQLGLQYLSGKRVWDEWQKTLLQHNSLRVLQLMSEKEMDITLFGEKFTIGHYETYQGNDKLLLTRLLLPFMHKEYLAHRLSLTSKQKEWVNLADNLAPEQDFREIYLQYGEKAKELVWYWACKYQKEANRIFDIPFWQIKKPLFPLIGKDILKLGCQPGPIVGDYLKSTHQWWVKNNFIPSYEDCLNYAKSLFDR